MNIDKNYYNNNCVSNQSSNKLLNDFDNWLINCAREVKGYKEYTSNGYFEDINNALRYDMPVDLLSETIISQTDKLFETMPSSYCVKSPEIVYRGIHSENLPDESADIITLKDKTKNTFTDKGFVSTSKEKSVAKSFKDKDGFLLKITLPSGTKRIKGNDLYSLMPEEEEITLPRNCKFRVDSYNPQTRTADITCLGQEYPLPEVRTKEINKKDSYYYFRNLIV